MIDRCLQQLFVYFQHWPHEFFHERELHTHFFALAREAGGIAATADNVHVHRLRYEYNSIWRYRGADGYVNRFSDVGDPLELDFALLRNEFIEANPFLTVVNKDENRRMNVRAQGEELDVSPAIEVSVEFKMQGFTTSMAVTQGQVNSMSTGMLKDCRKLAHERVGHGFIVGFSRGPLPNEEQARNIVNACVMEFNNFHPNGRVTVYLVTPTHIASSQNGEQNIAPPVGPRNPAGNGNDETTPEPGLGIAIPEHFFHRAVIVCYHGQHCHLNLRENGSFALRDLETMNVIVRGQTLAQFAQLYLDLAYVEQGDSNFAVDNTDYWHNFAIALANRHQCP